MADILNAQIFNPPVKGMNTAKPPWMLDPLEARSLINWLPKDGWLESRPGLTFFDNQPLSSNTLSAMYNLGTATGIVGVQDTTPWMTVYGFTSSGVDRTLVDSVDLNNATNYALLATVFKGTIVFGFYNNIYYWDGSAAAKTDISITGGNPAVSALGTYRSRVYIGTGSGAIRYGAPDTYAGTYKTFNAGYYLDNATSAIRFCGNLNGGGAAGAQNMFGVINGFGEFLVFQGDYPGHQSWSLIGKYQLPSSVDKTTSTTTQYVSLHNVVYVESEPHYICYEGIYNLTKIAQRTTLEEANIAIPVRDQLKTSFHYRILASYDNQSSLLFVPARLNIEYGPRANAYGFLVYNSATKAWTTYIIPDASTDFGNLALIPGASRGISRVYVATKDAANDLNLGYFDSTTSQDWLVSNSGGTWALPSMSVAHYYAQTDGPDRQKFVDGFRPSFNLTASTVSGTYAVSTDTQTTTPSWTADFSYSSTDVSGAKTYPVNCNGYLFSPRFTGTLSGSTTAKYLGAFLLYKYGSKF